MTNSRKKVKKTQKLSQQKLYVKFTARQLRLIPFDTPLDSVQVWFKLAEGVAIMNHCELRWRVFSSHEFCQQNERLSHSTFRTRFVYYCAVGRVNCCDIIGATTFDLSLMSVQQAHSPFSPAFYSFCNTFTKKNNSFTAATSTCICHNACQSAQGNLLMSLAMI